jgi:hypothetical protein
MASIIYLKDPKCGLEVCWSGPDRRKDTYPIAINGGSTRAGRDGLYLAELDVLLFQGHRDKVWSLCKSTVVCNYPLPDLALEGLRLA